MVVQKIGRDPDVTVRHEIARLSQMVNIDAVVKINYDETGRGIVDDKARGKEIEH